MFMVCTETAAMLFNRAVSKESTIGIGFYVPHAVFSC